MSSSNSYGETRSRNTVSVQPSASTTFNDKKAVKQFAEDTTIHGLKDLYRVWNQNGLLKWTWVLLLVGSTGAMVYEMVQVILNYLARPTATQISQVYQDSYRYPPMLFCPRQWINATRVKMLGVPKPSLAYALSLLHLISVYPDPPIVDFNETATQLHNLMAKYNFSTYFDFYLNISDDSDRTMTCPLCSTWPLEKRVTENGVCYLVDLKPAKISFLIEHPPQITYTPVYPSKRDVENWLPVYRTTLTAEQFYVGYYPNDFFMVDPIKLAHNKTYIIKVTPTLQRRFSGYQLKTGRGCYDKTAIRRMNHSQRMCYSDCEEWTYGLNCWRVHYIGFSYDRRGMTRPPWFSSLNYADIPAQEAEDCQKLEKANYDDCAAKCLPPCEEWIYDTTVVAVNNNRMWIDDTDDPAAITIVISYQVRAGTLAVEEISTYTYHTFLSNIGGQLGLWLGASVLSVFQLVFFLGRLAYEYWKDGHTGTGKRMPTQSMQSSNHSAQNGHG